MTQTAHTPGPLNYFVGNANGKGLIRIETDADAPVAGVHIASMPRGAQSEADAARLVLAWNCHEDMLEALKPKLSAKTRMAVNEWVEAMEAMGSKNDLIVASGLRFLLEQEDKRQAVHAKATGAA